MTSVNIPVVVETRGAIQRLRNVSGRVTDLNTRARGLGGSFLRGAILGGLLGSSLGSIASQLISTSNAGRAVTSSIQRLIQSLLQPIEGPLVRFLSAFDANPFLQGLVLVGGGLAVAGIAFSVLAGFVLTTVDRLTSFIGWLRRVKDFVFKLPVPNGVIRAFGLAFRIAGYGIRFFVRSVGLIAGLGAIVALGFGEIALDLLGFEGAADKAGAALDKFLEFVIPGPVHDFADALGRAFDGLLGIERDSDGAIQGIDLMNSSLLEAITNSEVFGAVSSVISGLWSKATNIIQIGWLLVQLGVLNILNAIVRANNTAADFFIRVWDAGVEKVQGFFYRLRTIAVDVVNFIIRAINSIPSIEISFETITVGPLSFPVPRVSLGGSLFNIAEIRDPGRPQVLDRFSDTGNDGDTYNVTVNAPNVFDTSALEEQLLRLLNQNAQFRNEVIG